MTEAQKRILIIVGVVILALILWLMGNRKQTVVQTPNGPVTFGNVDIPGINFPPRNTSDGIVIPGLNFGNPFQYGASTCMCDGGSNPIPFIPTSVTTMQSAGPVIVNAYQPPAQSSNYIYGFG